MENLRLGVSAVRHDMKREETVEEVEKNTELERQTPKRQVGSSNLLGNAKQPRKLLRGCFIYPYAIYSCRRKSNTTALKAALLLAAIK